MRLSKASFPLHNTEARQHQGNLDVTSDVVLSCCCCPSAGADYREDVAIDLGLTVGSYFCLVVSLWTLSLTRSPGVQTSRKKGSCSGNFSAKPRGSKLYSKVPNADSPFNSLQTRCIVKGEAQKSPLFWRFSGGFWFSQDRLFSRNSTRKPLNLTKSPIFTNAPCKTTCLYNAPNMHTC